ncbi:MAG: hypothetical protein V3V16_01645 [Melioribacteraceae bacterium]
MNRIIKVFLLLIISLNLISCSENYPKTVSQIDGFWSTNSRYEIDINNFNEFPEEIQDFTKQYLTRKIGKLNLDKSRFSYGYIASNKPINNKSKKNEIVALLYGEDSKENKELDTKYNYPVYSIGFEYSDLTKGIEKYDLTFIVDNNGKILKNISFPKVDLKSNNLNFIPLDSIHKILSERKISSRKLELDLRFDRKKQTTFYYARTFIRGGSIAGPSCFPEYQEHFKVNAITGEIIEYNSDDRIEYYNN